MQSILTIEVMEEITTKQLMANATDEQLDIIHRLSHDLCQVFSEILETKGIKHNLDRMVCSSDYSNVLGIQLFAFVEMGKRAHNNKTISNENLRSNS